MAQFSDVPIGVWGRARAFVIAHKVVSGIAAVIIVIGGWTAYNKATSTSGEPRYVLANAQVGTLITSVTGTGQVSASNELSLSPQASGQIVYIGVQDGQRVSKGALIAEVDPTDAQKKVRDAEASLQSAQIALQKLQAPPTDLQLAQSQNALSQASSSLETAYSNSASDIASTFLDLPSIMIGLEDVDLGTETNKAQQWNIDWYENSLAKYDNRAQSYRDDAYNTYQAARASYDATFADYKTVNLANTDTATIERLLSETYNTIKQLTNAVKSSNALIQLYSDTLSNNNLQTPAIATTHISSLASYTGKLSTHSSALFNDSTTIQTDKETAVEKTYSLQELQQGATALDIQAAQLSVQQAQNALQDAKDNLANYYVTAPFDGSVSLSVTPYQQVSSGTTVATLVTADQFAEITLNEVDAATVKVGNKATLTFDALPDLSIAGDVVSVAPVGTVSQGVVSYAVKIDFASQDPRIRPGMSVSAQIATQVKTDVLMVPSAAVHTSADGSSYVLAFNPPLSGANTSQGVVSNQTPQQISVTAGLSNDTSIEIVSGITQGQQIVVRTITSSQSTSAAPSILNSVGGNRGGAAGGRNVRIGG
ncbi:MAG TPA: efflux RND transporter periplasmic adaptor subunit [Candidatus Paceibacterota bacterium]